MNELLLAADATGHQYHNRGGNDMTNARLITGVCSLLVCGSVPATADAPTYTLECLLPVDGCISVDLSPDESLLYVRGDLPPFEGGLLVFDTSSCELIDTCTVPNTPWKFVVSADGQTVWCTRYYCGCVSKVEVDPFTCSISRSVSVGSWPVDLLFDDAKRYLYVGENHPGGDFPVSGSIQVIDTWTNQPAAAIPLNGQGGMMGRASMDQYLYTVTGNIGTERLYKIDTLDGWSYTSVDLAGLGRDVGISVHPDFSKVYVPKPSTNEVLIIDAATLGLLDTIPIGAPRGFFVAPSGDHAIVLHDDLTILSIVCLETQSIVQTMEVGLYAEWKLRPIWSQSGTTVYIPLATAGLAVLNSAPIVNLDIKPGSCPNSFNRNSHGVLPVALVGTGSFDVMEVDLSTVELSRADGVGGSVAPNEGPPGPHSVFEDVATPFDGPGAPGCDCHELGGDGITDLSMKFRTDDVVAALLLDDLPAGDLVELVVSGALLDGTPFSASDCIRLVQPGTPPGIVAVGSNAPGAFIDVTPLDLQLDGGGFGSFERTFPLTTAVTLTAPAAFHGWVFVGWRTHAGLHPDQSINITIEAEQQSAKAIYAPAGPTATWIVP